MVNQLPLKRFHLATLGRLALLDGAGNEEPTLGRRPRKLALLAILALERKALSRDRLADLFWGNREEARAKHSLSDAVSHLRHVLGARAIDVTRNAIALTNDAPLDVDAWRLVAAAKAGDHQLVISTYAGPFLGGVHVEASPSFEHWVDRRHAEYERAFVHSCQRMLDALDESAPPATVLDIAERWLSVEPAAERAALAMLSAHANMGRDGVVRALRAYGDLERRLRDELELFPAESVGQAVRQLRERLRDSIAVVPHEPESIRVDSELVVQPRRRSKAGRVMGLGVAIAALAAVLVSLKASSSPDGNRTVVVLPFAPKAADPSAQWLGDGAARLLAAKLSRADVDVVVLTPSWPDTMAATRRMGARWLITGSVIRHDSLTSLEILLRDPSSGAIARRFIVAEGDLISAADAAGVHLLSSLSWQNAGPALSGIETHSVDAYRHYVLALRASSESNGAEYIRNLDAAIALDSGFMSAVSERTRHARVYGEWQVMFRLIPLFQRHARRLGEWDRMELDLHWASNAGRASDTEAAARALLRRFPRDPRAYALAMHTFGGHGKFAAADSVFRAAARLDSATGSALCDPCADYALWVEHRLAAGDHAGAEALARSYAQRYPDRRASWILVARALARSGKHDEALVTLRRAKVLASVSTDVDADVVRILVASRQLRAADSIVRSIQLAGDTTRYLELRTLLERERGQYLRAARTASALVRRPGGQWAALIEANSLARGGRYQQATAVFERATTHPAQWRLDATPAFLHSTRSAARPFAWHHALEADAVAERCDTALLSALADSVEAIGTTSNYARDWTLHYHVRGIVHACEGRDSAAVAEFERSPYTPFLAWTATNVALARAQMRLKQPSRAIAALRPAYYSLPESMGWYVTRAELDLEMARAFRAMGAVDSAAVYFGYVTSAWAEAEPGARSRLARALTEGG